MKTIASGVTVRAVTEKDTLTPALRPRMWVGDDVFYFSRPETRANHVCGADEGWKPYPNRVVCLSHLRWAVGFTNKSTRGAEEAQSMVLLSQPELVGALIVRPAHSPGADPSGGGRRTGRPPKPWPAKPRWMLPPEAERGTQGAKGCRTRRTAHRSRSTATRSSSGPARAKRLASWAR